MIRKIAKIIVKATLVFGFLLLLCWEASANDLAKRWDDLSVAFVQALDAHEETVYQLQEQLAEMQVTNQEIWVSIIELQLSNDSLRVFNDQIGARMQERDEELVDCYNEIDSLKKVVKDSRVVITIMSLILIVLLILTVAFRV